MMIVTAKGNQAWINPMHVIDILFQPNLMKTVTMTMTSGSYILHEEEARRIALKLDEVIYG